MIVNFDLWRDNYKQSRQITIGSGVNKGYNHAMKWIWEQAEWPHFNYDAEKFAAEHNFFYINSERMMGQLEAMNNAEQQGAIIDLMLTEALMTSAIEGESLDRHSVRASLLKLMAKESISDNIDIKSAGAAALLVDVREEWKNDLSEPLLSKWQTMAVPDERHSLILRGMYRATNDDMTIASGYSGREKIHYVAPSGKDVPKEMERFLSWYNESNPLKNESGMPGSVRAGIAHLWFELIHPYEDGNGRVGRAIADHALSQSLNYPTTACIATAIESNKKAYYSELDRVCKGDLSIHFWLEYFTDAVNKAQDITKKEVGFIINKTRFFDAHKHNLNVRQLKMVERVFAEGRQGFKGGISTSKYETITKCPNRTASRDLADMLDKGMIVQIEGGGRSTRYELSQMSGSNLNSL